MACETCCLTDAEMYVGEDADLEFSMDPETNVMGWALAFAVKEYYDDSSPLFTKTLGSGVTITDASVGKFNVSLVRADTVSLAAKAYICSLVRTDTSAFTVLASGFLKLKPSAY